MIKLIASDLDSTALYKGVLSPENKKAIQKAVDSGIGFVLSTGRAKYAIPEDFFDIKEIKYAITCNGACISNIRTGELIRRFTLKPEYVRELLAIGEKYNVTYEVFVSAERGHVDQTYHDDPVKYGMLPNLVPYIRQSRKAVPDIVSFVYEHIDDVDNFAFVTPTKVIHDAIAKEVSTLCPETIMVVGEEQWVEVMDINSGKGKGVKFLAEYLGIDMKDVACFGDGDNDIEMLEFAGLPIAMENATDGCKKIASYIAPLAKESGLAYGIERILSGEISN